ncbi:serine/threonine-protein kinase [Laspinema sp. D1]|uniref:non-specific serine/threonine protein kinase n=1 Tax=Laspinema palackyanum D2a TaxID=2953684 RepID=A0ABT2MYA3_9CYAN|nr:serine/threonine-protein kinase [Laspinema sp. D2a]
MSYCLNPDCQKPQNPAGYNFCHNCGAKLLLGDRYRALKSIGQGGFGRTFLAVDEYKPSKPRCVIKQFFPQFQTPQNAQKAAQLFQKEAVRLDDLGTHPQIPALFAHFESDNYQYLVQEFIDGKTLAQELEAEGALSEFKVREVLFDLLPVLQFVHEKKVIHRDIKPENIIRRATITELLEANNEMQEEPNRLKSGQLVLVDFGAAKFATATALGRTGTVIGTAGYVAPEQFLGQAVPASDLYCLGVTCVQLLTATEPFSLFDVKEGVWHWRDYLLSPVTLEFAKVLDRLLEANLNRRYHSATEVLTDLDWLPPVTHRTTPKPKPSPGVRGNSPPPPPNNPSIVSRLMGATPQMIKGTILENLGKFDAAIASYDQAIALKPNNADAWYKKARLYAEMGNYDEALSGYEKTLELKPDRWDAWRDKGIMLYKLRRYQDAISSYLKALQFQPNQALIWLLMSMAIKQTGNNNEAQTTLDQARQLMPERDAERASMLWQAWEILIKN